MYCLALIGTLGAFWHVLALFSNKQKVPSHVARVTSYVSHVNCHLLQTQTATTSDPPLLTPLLCTVGWFTNTKTRKVSKILTFGHLDTMPFEITTV